MLKDRCRLFVARVAVIRHQFINLIDDRAGRASQARLEVRSPAQAAEAEVRVFVDGRSAIAGAERTANRQVRSFVKGDATIASFDFLVVSAHDKTPLPPSPVRKAGDGGSTG